MYLKMHMPFDFGFSFGEIMSMAGEGAEAQSMPPGFENVRMVMSGTMDGDMTALVPPNGSDLVKMQADMKMNMSLRMENLTPELAQGAPENLSMLADMRMSLDRIG
jgi:hypothetical protein